MTRIIPPADSDAWNLAEGKRQGQPILIRYRPGLEQHLGDPRYPRRLTISWAYDSDSSGLPSDQVADEMRTLEDVLDAALDPERLAILALIHTHGGVRRWHYYLGDVAVVGQRMNEALSHMPKFPIELDVENDPDWQELRLLFNKFR